MEERIEIVYPLLSEAVRQLKKYICLTECLQLPRYQFACGILALQHLKVNGPATPAVNGSVWLPVSPALSWHIVSQWPESFFQIEAISIYFIFYIYIVTFMYNTFRLTREEQKIYLIAFLTIFFSKFPLLSGLMNSSDDIFFLLDIESSLKNIGMLMGRYLFYLIEKLFYLLDITAVTRKGINFLLINSLLIFSGLLLYKMFSVKLILSHALTFVLLLNLHPYWATSSIFQVSYFTLNLSFCLIVLSIYLFVKKKLIQRVPLFLHLYCS